MININLSLLYYYIIILLYYYHCYYYYYYYYYIEHYYLLIMLSNVYLYLFKVVDFKNKESKMPMPWPSIFANTFTN